MKTVNIKNFSHAEVDAPKAMFGFAKIPIEHKLIRAEGEDLEVSDGYHTFDELYDHRITLFIALARICRRQEQKIGEWPNQPFVWRSRKHSDGELCFGTGTQYVLGIGSLEGHQMTYHIPTNRWEETNFAATLDKAPNFDGHTSADVLARLAIL
jgi:hypothetical protein